MFEREKEFLLDQMGPHVQSVMRDYKAFIAGGALTSVFSSGKINDFDVFFLTQELLDAALARVERNDQTIETDSALSFITNDRRVQFIKVVTGTPEEVIKTFDFTICQAAFSLKTIFAKEQTPGDYVHVSKFTFGSEFFHHLAQRRLVFNIDAEYPICSLYRLEKFIKRGFQFSGIEAIKLGLRIQALRLNTVEELRRQLMGIDTLFLKDLTDTLAGQAEKRYDFNEFMATLEIWLDRLNALAGVPDA